MTKVTIDRALIEQAVEFVRVHGMWAKAGSHVYQLAKELRAALAEPVVEPYAWVVTGTGLFSIGPQRPFDDDLWQPVYTSPPPPAEPAVEPFGYFRAEPFGWTDCAPTDEGAKALYEVPPPAEPAPVPLLSDEEIHDIYDEVARSEPYSGAVTRRNVARAIEQLVRRKAGL